MAAPGELLAVLPGAQRLVGERVQVVPARAQVPVRVQVAARVPVVAVQVPERVPVAAARAQVPARVRVAAAQAPAAPRVQVVAAQVVAALAPLVPRERAAARAAPVQVRDPARAVAVQVRLQRPPVQAGLVRAVRGRAQLAEAELRGRVPGAPQELRLVRLRAVTAVLAEDLAAAVSPIRQPFRHSRPSCAARRR